jgi:hypothetical protein
MKMYDYGVICRCICSLLFLVGSLGPFLAQLGPLLAYFGLRLAHLGPLLPHVRPPLVLLGIICGLSRLVLGSLLAHPGPAMPHLEPLWSRNVIKHSAT